MKLLGKRYSYPMVTTYAKKFVSHRSLPVNWSTHAVGMHPVTAQMDSIPGLQKDWKFSLMK